MLAINEQNGVSVANSIDTVVNGLREEKIFSILL
jgi:hypothetical protein